VENRDRNVYIYIHTYMYVCQYLSAVHDTVDRFRKPIIARFPLIFGLLPALIPGVGEGEGEGQTIQPTSESALEGHGVHARKKG
jgi:hypothetical protein